VRAPTPATPTYLSFAADAELRRGLEYWTVRVGADCTLPGGAIEEAAGTIYLSRLAPGKPFAVDTTLFRTNKLPGLPTACTFSLVLEDMYQMAREPLGHYCWRGDQVTPGRC
jgi:hypothetical protein